MSLGIDVGAIIDDYREAVTVRSSLASWDAFWRILNSGTTILSALLLIIYARKPPAISNAKSITAIAAYVVVQLALNVSNTQPATIYVAPACAVVLLSWREGSAMNQQLARQDIAGARTKSPSPWLPITVCLIVFIPQALSPPAGARPARPTTYR